MPSVANALTEPSRRGALDHAPHRRTPTRAREFFRTASGQVLPWTVILIVAMLPLALGAMGASAAYVAKDEVQSAADAAALAAVGEEMLWESLAVTWHAFSCRPQAPSSALPHPVCGDGPSETSNLARTFAAALFARTAGGLPGWAHAAGCDAVGGDPTPVPSGPIAVCDGWRLQPGGIGVSYGLAFPPGTDPKSVAIAYLQANTADLRAHGVAIAPVDLRTDATTGQVDLSVRLTEPGNPLALLAGRPLTLVIQAGARRRVPAPPASGS